MWRPCPERQPPSPPPPFSSCCRWAGTQLAESGEELIGLIHHPQYLLLAKTVLLAPLIPALPAAAGGTGEAAAAVAGGGSGAAGAAGEPGVPPSWWWWAVRAVVLQQRLLAARSATLRQQLLGLTEGALARFAGPVEAAGPGSGGDGAGSSSSSGSGATGSRTGGSSGGSSLPTHPTLEDRLLAAACLLEAALMETSYGAVSTADAYLGRCSAVLGFRAELAGALGVRTAHQAEPRAQLVLAVVRAPGAAWTAGGAAGALPGAGEDAAALREAGASSGGGGGGGGGGDGNGLLELKGLGDESDVLEFPRLVGGGNAAGAADPGSPAAPASGGTTGGSGGGSSSSSSSGEAAPAAAAAPAPAAGGSGTTGSGAQPEAELLPSDLHPIQQALLLARAQHVRKGTAADGLQPWEMAAYVDAVSRQQRSQFPLLVAARLQVGRSPGVGGGGVGWGVWRWGTVGMSPADNCCMGGQ